MAKLAYDEGLLLDVASGGELHVALAAGVPASVVRAARQQQVGGRAADGDRVRRAPHRRRLVRRARPARDARGRRCRPDPEDPPAGHAGRARPHPRVHRHRAGRLEVRLQPRQRRRAAGGRSGAAVARRRARRRALPHRFERVRGVVVRQGGRGDGRLRRAARPARAGARRRPRRGVRRERGGSEHRPVGQRPARRVRCARRAVEGQRRAGSGDRRVRGDDRLHRRHRSRRSPACARTSRSTVG